VTHPGRFPDEGKKEKEKKEIAPFISQHSLTDKEADQDKDDRAGLEIFFDEGLHGAKGNKHKIQIGQEEKIFWKADGVPFADNGQGSVGENKVLSEYKMIFPGQVNGDTPGGVQTSTGHDEKETGQKIAGHKDNQSISNPFPGGGRQGYGLKEREPAFADIHADNF
jgi:hypothetical protein